MSATEMNDKFVLIDSGICPECESELDDFGYCADCHIIPSMDPDFQRFIDSVKID